MPALKGASEYSEIDLPYTENLESKQSDRYVRTGFVSIHNGPIGGIIKRGQREVER